jgi:flagellar basal body-associated protein FliL
MDKADFGNSKINYVNLRFTIKQEDTMKRINKQVAFLSTILIVVALIVAGCASSGMQRSEKATTTMQSMDDEIKLVVVQLDATGASLTDLMKPGQSDVVKAFELYSTNVSKMEKLEKNFAKHAEEMKVRGASYFDEWQKQGDKYENPEIQALSEQRRKELGEVYGKIAENSVGMDEAFKAYMSDVKEIQSFLSNDLTSKGIEAITPISRKAVTDGNNLKREINKLQLSIEAAKSEMAHSSR